MAQHADAQAVLVTGVYGSGKSTVVADVGGLLEDRGDPYGVLDVDWLGWFDASTSAAAHRPVLLSNVMTVCNAYLAAGVRRFALARSLRNSDQLDAFRLAVPAPLPVVRLEVEPALVERRLSSDPTEQRRRDDLRVAQDWLAAKRGEGFGRLLPGDQPVRQTSEAFVIRGATSPAGHERHQRSSVCD